MQWKEFLPSIRHLSSADQQTVRHAFDLCLEVHAGQLRKSGDPYVTHPIAVALMLAKMQAGPDVLAAALLHDALEDTPLTLKKVEEQFSPAAAALIDGLTKLDDEAIRQHPTLDEEIESLRKMVLLMQEDVRIMVIKLADRLHNMQTVAFLPPERQITFAQETMDVYVKIAERMCMHDLSDELEELCLRVLDPQTYATLGQLRAENEQQTAQVLEQVRTHVLADSGAIPSSVILRSQRKSWHHLRLRANVTQGTRHRSDVTIAFLCETVAQCYAILGVLHQKWQHEIQSFKDFINAPAINGYRGLHTTILLQDGTRVRCKIRTHEMQTYAERGVASRCFVSKSMSIMDSLPWTERITSLSTDTADKSQEFWDSLQNDILGKSILIYGPDNRSVQLPVGSTALDGACYLFHDDTLSARVITIDGKEVPFYTPLSHGNVVSMERADKRTAHRDWLLWTKSGFGVALIRRALGERSEQERTRVGMELLQHSLSEHRMGYIEEFDPLLLEERIHALGYSSLAQVYTAIADGHLDPTRVAAALPLPPKKTRERTITKKKLYILSYTIPELTPDILRRMADFYEKHGMNMKDVRFMPLPESNALRVTISLALLPDELETFKREIAVISQGPLSITVRRPFEMALLGIVIVLWGINPVIAKWLLLQGVEPLALVTIRLLAFAVFGSVLYVVWRLTVARTFTRIPHATLAVLPSTLSMAALAFFTYWALVSMPPSLHLTILRINVLLLPVLHLFRTRTLNRRTLFLPSLILLSSFVALFLLPHHIPIMGIAFSFLSLFAYLSYSILTERTLQRYKIDIRYPSLLFQSSLILGLIGLLLLPFQRASSLLHSLTLPAILYVLVCVFVPHACFNAILKRMQFKFITDFFLLEVPIAILLETILLSITLPASLYLLMAGIIGAILLLRWRSLQTVVVM